MSKNQPIWFGLVMPCLSIGPKQFWTSRNCFGTFQIVLEVSNKIWAGLKYFGLFQNHFGSTKSTWHKCPKIRKYPSKKLSSYFPYSYCLESENNVRTLSF